MGPLTSSSLWYLWTSRSSGWPSRCKRDKPGTWDLAGMEPVPCEPPMCWYVGIAVGSAVEWLAREGHSSSQQSWLLPFSLHRVAMPAFICTVHSITASELCGGVGQSARSLRCHHTWASEMHLTGPCGCIHGSSFRSFPGEAAQGCISYNKSSWITLEGKHWLGRCYSEEQLQGRIEMSCAEAAGTVCLLKTHTQICLGGCCVQAQACTTSTVEG